jgi:hypothetical protein
MLENHVERLTEALVYNLCAIGEQVLIAARSTNSYKDQTGNLRSSVGYIVAIDGEVVRMSDFEPSERGTDKTTGQNTGKTYAQKLIDKYPKGIVLLVVAGMKYASYVSAKGLDVLDSSELLAERLIPQMLKQLGLK